MSIYLNNLIEVLNNEKYYYPGINSTELSLNFCKTINKPIDKKYNIFLYWIGNNVNYKHSVVLKSFIATQNLNNATLKIYSDVDISNNVVFTNFKKYKQIEFHIFNVEDEIKNTPYETNFKYVEEIKNHIYNPAYESDFFRVLMLYKYGGFYIDFDVLLLRDLSPLLDYNFLYQWGAHPSNMINGAIMHLIKNSNVNNSLTNILLNKGTKPGNGSLFWASELYLQVKALHPELIIFPASFFNSEWQSQLTVNNLLEPLKKHIYSNFLYDGCFTWHWHNRWEENIEEDSKFDILDKLLTKKININENINHTRSGKTREE